MFEKTGDDLASRGAGLGTHDEIFAVLEYLGITVDESIGVPVERRYCMDGDGNVVHSIAVLQRQSSWAWFYNKLKEVIPPAHYHFNTTLSRVEPDHDGVTAIFADGSRVRGDILIGADGIRSTVRAQICADAQPRFSGYVGWRGVLNERDFPPALRAAIFEKYIFCIPEGEMMLAYPVPGGDGDTRPGFRGYNFVWYHPLLGTGSKEDKLADLCTDAAGRCYGTAIPPPLIRPDVIADIRAQARAKFPEPIAQVVELTPQPFFQAIFDVESPRMVFGRVLLLGDAAFVARPHVGMGVTKAALDAYRLACVLEGAADLDAGLAAYNDTQSRFGHAAVAWARYLGRHLEAQLKPREQRSADELTQDPTLVLRQIGAKLNEIAALDIGVDLPRSSGRVPTWVCGRQNITI